MECIPPNKIKVLNQISCFLHTTRKNTLRRQKDLLSHAFLPFSHMHLSLTFSVRIQSGMRTQSRLSLLFTRPLDNSSLVSYGLYIVFIICYFSVIEPNNFVFSFLFYSGKSKEDDLFDELDTSKLNAHLKELVPGLTAKVFRTYNASFTLDDQVRSKSFFLVYS